MKAHLRGKSYCEHFTQAINFSFQAFKASIVLTIHAIYPLWFEWEGGNRIKDLHNEIQNSKKKTE